MAGLIVGLWLGLIVVDTVTLVVAILAIKVQSLAKAHPKLPCHLRCVISLMEELI